MGIERRDISATAEYPDGIGVSSVNRPRPRQCFHCLDASCQILQFGTDFQMRLYRMWKVLWE